MRQYESPSSIGMWSRCQQQYYWRYLEGLKMRPGIALLVGGGVDKGAQVDLTVKQQTGGLADLAEVLDETAGEVRKRWSEAEETLGGVAEQDADLGATVDEAVSLVTCYHNDLAPAVSPTEIQQKFELDIDGLPFGLMGFIDYVDGDDVIDLKTGKRRPDPNTSLQLVVYSMARQVCNVPAPRAGFDVVLKTKTPKAERIYRDAAPGADDYDRLFRRLDIMARSIESGIFAPASEGHWCCTPQFCGFHWKNDGPCKHGQ